MVPRVSMRGIKKRFGSIEALRGVDLEWRSREGFEKGEQVRFFFLCQTKWLHEGAQILIGPTAFV